MSKLSKRKMHYEDLPFKPYKHGGKAKKMADKKVKSVEAKTRGEHVKDIIIAVLVTGIIAFIAGTQYANAQNDRMNEAVANTVQTEADTVQPKK